MNLDIEEVWTDSQGSLWYKGQRDCGWFPYAQDAPGSVHYFWLLKISAAGTVLEYVSREGDYPTEMGRVGGEYLIYYKQE